MISLAVFAKVALAATTCNIGFYSGTGCSGDPDTTCNPSYAPNSECYWNTYVGSASYDCSTQASSWFEVCDGDSSSECNSPQTIAVPADSSGCVKIDTYDGKVTMYNNNYPGGGNLRRAARRDN